MPPPPPVTRAVLPSSIPGICSSEVGFRSGEHTPAALCYGGVFGAGSGHSMGCFDWARRGAAIALFSVALFSVRADAAELRVQRSPDLANLPLLIVEHDHLIEKHADMRGLGDIAVRWLKPGKAAGVDAVTSGEVDFAAVDLPSFVASWDEQLGMAQEIRALAALQQMPYVLVTRNPAIKTIRDFTDKDRIAVGAKSSAALLLLEMAAAQEWGAERFNRLDSLAVTRAD